MLGTFRQLLQGGRRSLPLRPVSFLDHLHMKAVGPGRVLRIADNPGLRVEPNFIADADAARLVAEIRTQLLPAYGFSALMGSQLRETQVLSFDADGNAADKQPGFVESSAAQPAMRVNAVRVTGRFENAGSQKIAPWGYGDEFDVRGLSPQLKRLVSRIEELPYGLGPIRDVTINYRNHYFFKDGGSVFVLNLLSNVVFTISPVKPSPGAEVRKDPAEIAWKSWTDDDIDLLVKPNWLLNFCGAARYEWNHGIRNGVEITEPERCFADWFGNIDNLFARSPERISVVVAFK